MAAAKNFPLQIRKLLLTNSVMSLKQLRDALNDRPRSSLFRDLGKLDSISSYTHTGQYHSLYETARFDENGIWFYRDVGFSQYGTLKKTLVQVISHHPIGMTHAELKKLFRIEVQKPLTGLINTNAVTRRLLPSRIYVYLSTDASKAEEQFQRRLSLRDRPNDIILPPETIRIEILVEIIRTAERTLDEKVLGPQLRKRGVVIRDNEIAYVLAYYDIKKNGF
jgi:hypothetical protein